MTLYKGRDLPASLRVHSFACEPWEHAGRSGMLPAALLMYFMCLPFLFLFCSRITFHSPFMYLSSCAHSDRS